MLVEVFPEHFIHHAAHSSVGRFEGLVVIEPVVIEHGGPRTLIRRKIGRPAKSARKPRDVAHIITLRCPGQPMHVHVLKQALTQRRCAMGSGVGHRSTPLGGRSRKVCLRRASLNRCAL